MPAPTHVVSVSIYDESPDQQRLLAATLYGLGCRTANLDCRSAAPEKLAAQLVAAPPDVLVWQVGSASDGQYPRLRRLMEDGILGQSGIVVATPEPTHASSALGSLVLTVTLLPAPFTLAALMHAIRVAQASVELAVRH